jgi:acid phosphatase
LLAGASKRIPIQTQIPGDVRAGFSPTNSISADKLLVPNERSDFKKLLSEYVLHTPPWVSTNTLLRPQFGRWSQALNTNIVNIHGLIIPADALYVHQVHHVPLAIPLGPGEVQTIINVGRWAFVYQYQEKVGQITGKPFLKKIAEYINDASQKKILQKKNPVKYVLFSAHDSTLLSEMSALQAPLTNGNAPPYASLLDFGLFETSRTNFYVQVTYHDNTDHIVANPETGGASWSLSQLSSLADQ